MTPRDAGWMPVVALTLVLAVAPAAVWGGQVAAAQTGLSDCATLDQSDTTYLLESDITNTDASTCFEVTAEGVVLDGNGHTVDGTGSNAIAVDATNDSVTVRDLTVTEFDTAVVFNGVDGGRVESVSTADLGGQGVFVSSSPGTVIEGGTIAGAGDEGIFVGFRSTDVVVRDVRVENAGKEGIFVSVTDANATIEGTVVTGTDRAGIRLADASSTVLRDTVVRSAGGAGIRVETAGQTLVNNTVRDNAGAGVAVTEVAGVSISDLTATDNDGHGLRLRDVDAPDVSGLAARRNGGAGIRLLRSNGASIADVTATDNARGVALENTSDAVLTNVTASANAEWAYHASAGSTGNALDGLTIDSATVSLPDHRDVAVKPAAVPGDVPGGKDDVGVALNLTATAEAGGIIGGGTPSYAFVNVSYGDTETVVESSLRLYGHQDGSWTEVGGTNGVDTAADEVYANVTFETSGLDTANVYAPLGDRAGNVVTSCGEIGSAGKWVLDANLSASGTCLAVTASDVRLLGDGHVLTGDGSGTGVVVNDSATNVSVSGLNATGFARGVGLQNVSDVTVEVTVANNAGAGVLVNGSSDVDVTANATGNGGGDGGLIGIVPAADVTAGVLVVDSTAVAVSGSTLTDNDQDGLRAVDASDLSVTGVTATGNANGVALVNVTDATVAEVNASSNDADGVLFDDTTGAVLEVSTAVGNGEWSVRGVNGAADNPIRRLSVGSATVTVERWRTVAIGPTAEADEPPAPEGNLSRLGPHVNATATATGGYAELGVAYDDTGVDESAVSLARYNGSSWVVLDSTVDAAADVVTANVSNFSAFAPVENTSAGSGDGSDGDDGDGGDGGDGDGGDGGDGDDGDDGDGGDGDDGGDGNTTDGGGGGDGTGGGGGGDGTDGGGGDGTDSGGDGDGSGTGTATPTASDDGAPPTETPTDDVGGGGGSDIPGGVGWPGIVIGGLAGLTVLAGGAYYVFGRP